MTCCGHTESRTRQQSISLLSHELHIFLQTLSLLLLSLLLLLLLLLLWKSFIAWLTTSRNGQALHSHWKKKKLYCIKMNVKIISLEATLKTASQFHCCHRLWAKSAPCPKFSWQTDWNEWMVLFLPVKICFFLLHQNTLLTFMLQNRFCICV